MLRSGSKAEYMERTSDSKPLKTDSRTIIAATGIATAATLSPEITDRKIAHPNRIAFLNMMYYQRFVQYFFKFCLIYIKLPYFPVSHFHHVRRITEIFQFTLIDHHYLITGTGYILNSLPDRKTVRSRGSSRKIPVTARIIRSFSFIFSQTARCLFPSL